MSAQHACTEPTPPEVSHREGHWEAGCAYMLCPQKCPTARADIPGTNGAKKVLIEITVPVYASCDSSATARTSLQRSRLGLGGSN